MKNKVLIFFLFYLFFVQCHGQNLEHELFLRNENELKEHIFPKPINNDSIKSFSIKSLQNQNTVFHFWTKSENEFFENELILLQKLQVKYQGEVRITVITSCNEKTVKKIIDNYKIEIPIVIDTLLGNVFHCETPFSVCYDSTGTLKSMTYSISILEMK